MLLHCTLFILAFISITQKIVYGYNSRPVVGILSQPLDGENSYYIAASYVKWLESAGARSIPIPYDADQELVSEIFSQINGLLFPGGAADLPITAKYLWDLAVDRNLNGDFFPIWGTCLGFEFMLMLVADKGALVLESGFMAENISLPLLFPTMDDVRRTQGVFSSLSQLYSSPQIRRILTEENVTMNNHRQGISPETFLSDRGITSLFHATSTNIDSTGRPFISTIESFTMPFFATQYHPEKNNFEYANAYPNEDVPFETINHSQNAVYVSQHLANFFVSQTRKNKFGRYSLVERYPLVFSYPMKRGQRFEQIFIIPPVQQSLTHPNGTVSTLSYLRGSLTSIK